MASPLAGDLFQQEQGLLQSIREKYPEMLERKTPIDPADVLARIGVTYLPTDRLPGYLRLYPQDFLVEEILESGEVVRIAQERPFQDGADRRTLWVDVIKANIAGPHALSDLQNILGITAEQIGYSGVKDAVAVTAQRMTLRGITVEQARAIRHEQMWLRPVAYGNGALRPGALKGNQFTIYVRTPAGDDSITQQRLDTLVKEGFLNFYGPQRFGPRIISHRLGRSLLRGNADEAIRLFCGDPGPYDVPLYRNIRSAVGNVFGDWKAMKEQAKRLPFSLRDEMTVLSALEQNPHRSRAALSMIKDQVKFWFAAYASWLINRYLSDMAAGKKPIKTVLPLPLASNGPLPEYADYMEADGTTNYHHIFEQFSFFPPTDGKTIPVRLFPEKIQSKRMQDGWILRFQLHKGAYATSCLSHAFCLYEGLPMPEWAGGEAIDTLAALNDGTLAPIIERFNSVLTRRDQVGQKTDEE